MKDFRAIYKNLARSKKLTKNHVLQYCILKGMDVGTYDDGEPLREAKRHIHRAFSPIVSKSKLDNGRQPFDTVYHLLMHIDINLMFLGSHSKTPDYTQKVRVLDVPIKEMFEDYELEQYRAIIQTLKEKYSFHLTAEVAKRYYVYTFVRQDISPEYQLVQAAHATARMGYGMASWPKAQFDELYFTVVGVPDDAAMAVAMNDCKEVGAVIFPFYEPDIGNILTAFSTNPIRADRRKRLLSYKWLKFSRETK